MIIIKEASEGYEDVEPIILQGHMDMVCEKAPDCDKDMDEEGLDLLIDGDFISAKGTTLGGDDGIAVAYALAILDDVFTTGCKVANPKITVWQISGDGDGLAIGGNHFIHAVRRNIDLNMILLNNRIYGLTKGQYSPTSPRGFVSKSSPYGTVEDPFHPAELCFGARGRFFARAVATDGPGTVEILKAAANHKGAAVCEILQNCVIFNDGTHESVYTKEGTFKECHLFGTRQTDVVWGRQRIRADAGRFRAESGKDWREWCDGKRHFSARCSLYG